VGKAILRQHADIRLAAEMTAGSGALYKHFSSKQALLAEVVGTHTATMRQGRRSFAETAPDDLQAALRHLVYAVWAAMRRDHQVLRVLLRDLDKFPELLDQLWREIRTDVYDEFTAWLTARKARGLLDLPDPEATSAVLLASLTYYPILDTLIGHTPADLAADRFAEAWISTALATLPGAPTSGE
jgi:AcrR family transcriptional regulator